MKLMRKDLRLAMGLVSELGTAAPLASEVGRLWAASAPMVADDADFNRIVQFTGK